MLDTKFDKSSVANTLTSTSATDALAAAQGKVLMQHINNINNLISSDNNALDTLQEIVEYIQVNRADLENLTIGSIAGLQATLDTKVNAVAGKGLSSEDYTLVEKNKLAGVEDGAQANVGDVFDANGTFAGLRAQSTTAADVGLDQVDNTTDLAKPVSSAQQTALNAKVDIASIVDGLTSAASNQPLSANQGLVLKGHIDNINTILQSDTGTLDSLQEIVNYIQLNRADLENLGISSIAGLQGALDNKLGATAKAVDSDKLDGRDSTSFADAQHNHPWTEVSSKPATATRWPNWGEVSAKPTTFPPSAHNHDADYLKKSGDTVNGDLTVAGTLIAGGAAIGPKSEVVEVTTNAAAQLFKYHVFDGAHTLTLPAAPSPGDWVRFINVSTETPTIANNGKPIMGVAEDLLLDIYGKPGTLTYLNSTQGWILS